MAGTQRVETELAIIVRTNGNMVETRFKEGAKLSAAGMLENIQRRRILCGDDPHVMLTVIPEEAEFDMDLMGTDMFQFDGSRANLQAIAVVAPGAMISMVMKLYFSYFPQVFHTEVFMREVDARVWLERKQRELALATG